MNLKRVTFLLKCARQPRVDMNRFDAIIRTKLHTAMNPIRTAKGSYEPQLISCGVPKNVIALLKWYRNRASLNVHSVETL